MPLFGQEYWILFQVTTNYTSYIYIYIYFNYIFMKDDNEVDLGRLSNPNPAQEKKHLNNCSDYENIPHCFFFVFLFRFFNF